MSNKQELIQEANELGLTFSPNIGEATLKKKIEDYKLAQEVIAEATGTMSKHDMDNQLRHEANKLTRVRVTCMNPSKQKHQGTWVMGGNAVVGTMRKMIPYNVDWFIPEILLNVLKERQFTIPTNKGNERQWVREVQIEYLPDLTPAELDDLRHQQTIKATKE